MQWLQLVLQEVARQKQRRSERMGRVWHHFANVPWVPVLSSFVAAVGWLVWVIYAERARRDTHAVMDAFGLKLVHEPWPMWATVPISLGLVKAGLMIASLTLWRTRIEKARDLKGTLFEPGHAQRYFLASVAASMFVWFMVACVLSVLVGMVVWAVAAVALERAAGQVSGNNNAADSSMQQSAQAIDQLLKAALSYAASVAKPAGNDRADGGVMAPSLHGWIPDYPGSVGCFPGCFDLSGFKYYLGDGACLCNWIGGWDKAEPYAHKAACHLGCAMVGLAMLYAGGSWMMINLACQFSHTQSEVLLLMEPEERQAMVGRQAKALQAKFSRKAEPPLLEEHA